MFRKFIPFILIVFISLIFFWQVLFRGLIPVPADTIIGLYHPYRDLYSNDYPNGIPYKNFLITDPVRQQYPWKNLVAENIKEANIPTWNPYSFSGAPFVANFQSSFFYPLNIIFLLSNFTNAWTIFIILQPILAWLFLYLYLRNIKIDKYSSFLGGLIFAFSGFFVTWLEWGNVLHTALWIPLILLSIDKILILNKEKIKNIIPWITILTFSISSSFLAGHLQTFFYSILLALIYFILRTYQFRKLTGSALVLISFLISLVIVLPQLLSTTRFINLSARGVDQNFLTEGWFIPWQHLIQIFSPDFFGNPTTLNYWGAWNYGELTIYAGIVSITLVFFALLFRRDKKTIFFGSVLMISLIFSLPTLFARLPYILEIPFLSSSQPTRLIFLTNFSMSVLAALGLSYLQKSTKVREIGIPIIIVSLILFSLYIFTLVGNRFGFEILNLEIARRNLVLPVIIFLFSSSLFLGLVKTNKKKLILIFILVLMVFDLFRFSWKFNTFTEKKYLYPKTESLIYIQKNLGNYRIGAADDRILPPNFNLIYKISSVDGYDPLYLTRYGEFISAINRNQPDISTPFGFNRIVRLKNFDSNLIDLLGVKYVLSFSELSSPKFNLVFEEGQTKIYENINVLPKAFFVKEIIKTSTKQETISVMFDNFDSSTTAVVEEYNKNNKLGMGRVMNLDYSDNRIEIKVENETDGFLVINDSYYPGWSANMDGSVPLKIYRTNYNFRGILIPKGVHEIVLTSPKI